MTTKHQHPDYRKNSRAIRTSVTKARAAGNDINCWRCGWPIEPDQTYDVGHLNPHAGHSRDNLAPEHRYRTPYCQGNRSAGGRTGAATQARARGQATKTLPLHF